MNAVLKVRLPAALVAVWLVFVALGPANADSTGCDLLADMAIVARALAQEGVPQDLSRRIMARIYTAPASLISSMAASAAHDTRSPAEVANAVLQACHRRQGSRDGRPVRKTL